MKIDAIYRTELEANDLRFRGMASQIGGCFRVEDVVEGKQVVAILPALRKHLDAYMDDPHNKDIRQLVEQLAQQAFEEIMNRTE